MRRRVLEKGPRRARKSTFIVGPRSGVHSSVLLPPAVLIRDPPLSLHLHHSLPAPVLFLPLPLRSTPLSLSLSINLPPPSTSPPLPSVCLPVPPTHFTLLPSEKPPFTFTLSILHPLHNLTPYVSIALVLCHSRSAPHLLLKPPLASSFLPHSCPYFSLPVCFIKIF